MATMFAKRHYEVLAQVMRNAHPALPPEDRAAIQWSETTKDIAEMLAQDNVKFDIIRFMHACIPAQ